MMRPIIQKTLKNIRSHRLLEVGDTVLIGVSGGPDSMALLAVLYALRSVLGIKIIVGHINHQLRSGAGADERFVKNVCRTLNLSCHVCKVTIPKKNGSLEELAREKRLSALIRIARRENAGVIALAHHQDDLAETVLMRILRGSGLMGLQGIAIHKKIHDHNFIRPFLNVPKNEIESFLRSEKIKFRTDPTNRQTRFFRNKIRLKLLPLLKKEYQPSIQRVLAQLADTATLDYDFLESKGREQFKKCCVRSSCAGHRQLKLKTLARLHPGILRLVLRQAIAELKGDTRRLTLAHIIELTDLLKHRPVNSVVHLPEDIAVLKTQTSLVFKTAC